MNRISFFLIVLLFLAACTGRVKKDNINPTTMAIDSASQYGYNRDFLDRHVKIIELKDGNSALVLIPTWQGRVMTSTASGDHGFSFGWINHKLIASGVIQPHINAFGGEERLWLGPEGGQFSIYFKKGDRFIYDNWQVPAWLDTIPFEVISQTDSSAIFALETEAQNYSGTNLKFRIEREVTLLKTVGVKKNLGFDLTGLNSIAYRSSNKLINKGDNEWIKETGLLSVWMLGMFNPSPSVVVVIPYNTGDEKVMGPTVNDNYFGKISEERLKVTDSHIFFRADGKSRGKIGISPMRTGEIMGSYDSANNILTILICRLPEGNNDYVNSAWQIQENPYSGDALNSYNDGPLEDGSQMGPFYELETSSPAAALKPGEEMTHVQYTLHITGNRKLLNDVAVKALGVSLDKIEEAFN
ncbi:MAG: hypothetical protein NT092_03105 [Bacteroidia bacterium]|nr:hypothetical protein [Bacteroidia bacterium]